MPEISRFFGIIIAMFYDDPRLLIFTCVTESKRLSLLSIRSRYCVGSWLRGHMAW